MNAALAARVEASVRGQTRLRRTDATLSPGIKTAVRLGAAVGLLLLGALVVREQRLRERTLTQARSTLLAHIDEATQVAAQQGSGGFATARSRLEREAQEYLGDVVDPHLQSRRQVDTLLRRAALYVRLPAAPLVDPRVFERAVAESRLDSFALCLKDAPAGRTEAQLIERVGVAHRGGEGLRQRAPATHRLYDALVVARSLEPDIVGAVEQAETLAEVNELQKHWNAQRVTDKLGSAQAELLIAVLDEPKTPGTVVELDGASHHPVRVVIADLTSGQTIARWRRQLDPTWVSDKRRAYYAAGLEGCRLAYDFRQHLYANTKPAGSAHSLDARRAIQD